MGDPCPLTWSDLWTYGQATGAIDEPWEYEALQAMSRAYLDGYQHGKSHFAISPMEMEADG